MSSPTNMQSLETLWHVQSDARIWDKIGETADELADADTRARYEAALEHYREASELAGRRPARELGLFVALARTALEDARRALVTPDERRR